MGKKYLKIMWITLILAISTGFITPNYSIADDGMEVEWIRILPEMEDGDISRINAKISEIWSVWWHVWDNYNDAAQRMPTDAQISSWIMNRDTIMNYLVYIVQFLSQLWITVGAVFIIYAWYSYLTSVFNWWRTKKEVLVNAIEWVIIVIFSYAIMKILTSFIGLS